MRVLVLVSDWKWTGSAEPALVLIRALRERGHRVELVCPRPPPGADRSLFSEATRRGIEPRATIAAGRSAWQAGDREQVAELARWLVCDEIGGPFDVVHCWHTRDHVLAARARSGRVAPGVAPPRIVRSLPRAEPIAAWPWNRWLFGRACDGLVCPSEASARAARRVRARGPIAGLLGAVEMAAGPEDEPEVDPDGAIGSDAGSAHRTTDAEQGASMRARLGLAPDAFVVGVVARLQRHRRFDLLLAAFALLAARQPAAKLLILGRGTHAEEVVERPVRALGLEEKVVRAGHRREDYAACLAAMDVFTYLVPGSDGTCRALLEAAASGLPLVATRRGAIPEIVREDETGILVDEHPEALCAAWEALARDPAARHAMGERALRDARIRFAPARLAEQVEAFYAEVVRSAPTSSR